MCTCDFERGGPIGKYSSIPNKFVNALVNLLKTFLSQYFSFCQQTNRIDAWGNEMVMVLNKTFVRTQAKLGGMSQCL